MEYCQMRALRLSACLCFSLLGFLGLGIAAAQETAPGTASPGKAEGQANQQPVQSPATAPSPGKAEGQASQQPVQNAAKKTDEAKKQRSSMELGECSDAETTMAFQQICAFQSRIERERGNNKADEIFQLVREQRRLTQAKLDTIKNRNTRLEDDLKNEMYNYNYNEYSDLQSIEQAIFNNEKAIEAKTRDINSVQTTDKKAELEEEKSELESTKDYLIIQKKLQKVDAEIKSNSEKIAWLESNLANVDSQLASTLRAESAKDNFKSTTSVYFVVLIGIVILGFFLVTLITRTAGQIFSDQSGLQFITLFSLVIAIVLFGILGILEGKELSALLGAISGYVLGRVSAGEVQTALKIPNQGGDGTSQGTPAPRQAGPGAAATST